MTGSRAIPAAYVVNTHGLTRAINQGRNIPNHDIYYDLFADFLGTDILEIRGFREGL